MPVVISMLRGVNVVGRNKIKMDVLRDLYVSLGLLEVQTHVQSGNVVFKTKAKDLATLAKQIEDAIERKFGFRPSVLLRTTSELRDVVARNPFANRTGIDNSKFLVTFLATAPRPEVRDELVKVKTAGEEVHVGGCELYIYFPDGMGRSKLWRAIERTLKKSGTGRNWNTVTKLLEIAEHLERVR
ncbi:MAG TPA: DUF1697 domain-containing protein [Terriglobales bacterium]|nr:DUF1697 domain-containing protein [Terriglobales bacterium]